MCGLYHILLWCLKGITFYVRLVRFKSFVSHNKMQADELGAVRGAEKRVNGKATKTKARH